MKGRKKLCGSKRVKDLKIRRNINEGITSEGINVSMPTQVADVKTALASVYRMVQAGNRVHFERDNCYIQHIATGRVTPMLEVNGGYEIGLWVPSQGGGQSGDAGFHRQGR